MSAVEDWTGDRPVSCPWRAFFDPFVARVLRLYGFFESGQLGWYAPNPSYRVATGIAHYHRVRCSVVAKGMEKDAEERKRRG